VVGVDEFLKLLKPLKYCLKVRRTFIEVSMTGRSVDGIRNLGSIFLVSARSRRGSGAQMTNHDLKTHDSSTNQGMVGHWSRLTTRPPTVSAAFSDDRLEIARQHYRSTT